MNDEHTTPPILEAVREKQEEAGQRDELAELRELRKSDPLAYHKRRSESAKKLGISKTALDEIVPKRADRVASDALTGRESQATELVKLASSVGLKLSHEGDECYASAMIGGHAETHMLSSRAIRRWLTHLYFECMGKVPGAEAVRCAIETLAGQALFKSEERKTHIRVAGHDRRLYLDLCNGKWQVVQITPEGWQIVEARDCPVAFRRAAGMLALPTPERGGSIRDLRPFANVSDRDWPLFVGFLLACYRDRKPYPILALKGGQGSAKTSVGVVACNLVDPNVMMLRDMPKEPRDLAIAANNSWLLGFDNLSYLPRWFSDGLCRLSTGAGFSTRALYTDSEEAIFSAARPSLLTSITDAASESDILDRALVSELLRIPDDKRLTEAEFDSRFNEAYPAILGALLDAVSCALANVDSTKLDRLPRMADLAQWVTAAESALGWKPQTFLHAYMQNREDANEVPLEASLVAAPFRGLVATFGNNAEHTASQLLAMLNARIGEALQKTKGWPKTGKGLSNALRRIAPNLRVAGIDLTFSQKRESGTGGRLIVIKKVAPAGEQAEAAFNDAAPAVADDECPFDVETPGFRCTVCNNDAMACAWCATHVGDPGVMSCGKCQS